MTDPDADTEGCDVPSHPALAATLLMVGTVLLLVALAVVGAIS